MNIHIYPINMYLLLNSDNSNKGVLFQKSFLPSIAFSSDYTPSKHPFFTEEVLFSDTLFYGKGTVVEQYQQRVRFFFDRAFMQSILNQKRTDKDKDNNNNNNNNNNNKNNNKDNNKTKYGSQNMVVMMSYLFPQMFPSLHTTSLAYLFPSSDILAPTNKGLVHGPDSVILQTCWLNDVINHPLYRAFIESVKNYYLWATAPNNPISREYTKKQEKFMEEMKIIWNEKQEGIRKQLNAQHVPSTNQTAGIIQLNTDIQFITDILNLSSSSTSDVMKQIISLDEIKSPSLQIILQVFKKARTLAAQLQDVTIQQNSLEQGQINIASTLWTKYKPYTNVIAHIKQIMEPVRISSNNKLQELIDIYALGDDKEGNMVQFVGHIFANYLGDVRMVERFKEREREKEKEQPQQQQQQQQYMDTGITRIEGGEGEGEAEASEVYILVNIAKISPTTNIKCAYRNESLGKKWELGSVNTYDLLKNRISSTFAIENTNEPTNQPTNQPTSQQNQPTSQQKMGGYRKKTLRRTRTNRNRTNRNKHKK